MWKWVRSFICLFIYLFIYLSVYLFIYLFIYLFVCVFVLFLVSCYNNNRTTRKYNKNIVLQKYRHRNILVSDITFLVAVPLNYCRFLWLLLLFIASENEVIQIKGVISIFKQISKEKRVLLSHVSKLQTRLLVNLAVSAVNERGFLTLRRLKTVLRTTISQERLSNFTLWTIYEILLNGDNATAAANEFIGLQYWKTLKNKIAKYWKNLPHQCVKYRNFTWFPVMENLRKLYLSKNLPQQEIRWNYGILYIPSSNLWTRTL